MEVEQLAQDGLQVGVGGVHGLRKPGITRFLFFSFLDKHLTSAYCKKQYNLEIQEIINTGNIFNRFQDLKQLYFEQHTRYR